VIWLIRGGVLLSSMLSALPAWQMLDPLPVVASSNGKRRKPGASTGDDGKVEQLFDDKRQMPAAPAQTAADPAATPTDAGQGEKSLQDRTAA